MTIRNLLGQRFGRLIVIEITDKRSGGSVCWLCKCDCGNFHIASSNSLVNGNTRSCGCLQKEYLREWGKVISKGNITHGMAKTKTWNAYYGMMARCYKPTNKQYHNYGGRGIMVDPRWLGEHGFESFLEDMGKCPSKYHSLDRIDFNGNYCKENCRWSTPEVQGNNTRANKCYLYGDKFQSISQWRKELNVSYDYIHDRLKKGVLFEEIVEEAQERNRVFQSLE